MNTGLGVMIYQLSGGNQNDPVKYYGMTIVKAEMSDERLTLEFADGKSIEIWDNGQSCCERRYMSTDDNVASLTGQKLVRIEAKDGPSIDDDYNTHEQVFVEIGTDKGFITIVNHNEHNGYYGGFGLTITEKDHA